MASISSGMFRSKSFFVWEIFDLPQIVAEVLLQGGGQVVVPVRGDVVARAMQSLQSRMLFKHLKAVGTEGPQSSCACAWFVDSTRAGAANSRDSSTSPRSRPIRRSKDILFLYLRLVAVGPCTKSYARSSEAATVAS